jgi:hypothetical protein
MKQRSIILMVVAAFIFINFIPTTQVTAQDPVAFGEIKAGGDVQIESSVGKWVKVHDIYPLLKNTKLRTDDGIVFITTKNGSRIDLSRNTEASIDATNESCTINLVKGTLTFNMTPSESFIVMTENAIVKVSHQDGSNYPLVAGVGAPAPSNIQGMVFNDEEGTFVKSDSGKINVLLRDGSQQKVLNNGQTLLALKREKRERRRRAAGAVVPSDDHDQYAIWKQGLIVGGFLATGAILTPDGFRGEGTPSPTAGWNGFFNHY